MKKYCFIICCLFLLIVSGCSSFPKERVIASTQMCYAVPAGYNTDDHSSWVSLVEEDNYGRMLFVARSGSASAILITQKADSNYVYYYDNVNYLYIEDYRDYRDNPDYLKTISSDIEELKVLNDWNKDGYNDSLMVRRPLNSKDDLFPEMTKDDINNSERVAKIFESNILRDGYDFNLMIVDKDLNGKELYFIEEGKVVGNALTDITYYLLIFNADGAYDEEKFFVKFKDMYESNTYMAEIKEKNGWAG